MPKNFWWVFAAYTIVWVALFAYVASLVGRQRSLERDVQRLKEEAGRR